MSKFIVHISKEYLKFSSAHFTIFDDNDVERMHGHNYYVSLNIECRDSNNGITFDFKHIKRIMEGLCDQLDEKILLPTESKYLKLSKNRDQFEVVFSGSGFTKNYSFPCEDVEILPISNVTSELLAKYLCDAFCRKLESSWNEAHPGQDIVSYVISVAVKVEETRGQAASYVWEY